MGAEAKTSEPGVEESLPKRRKIQTIEVESAVEGQAQKRGKEAKIPDSGQVLRETEKYRRVAWVTVIFCIFTSYFSMKYYVKVAKLRVALSEIENTPNLSGS